MGLFTGKFNNAKQEWETPQELFNKLNEEFHFILDLAADSTNHKCTKYLTKEDNSLLCTRSGICWLNPPYGSRSNKLSDWVKKAYDESVYSEYSDTTVVMLIPARTNTKWWHKYCMKAQEVRFICGRPKFGDASHGLPQPLALVIFGKPSSITKFSSFYI